MTQSISMPTAAEETPEQPVNLLETEETEEEEEEEEGEDWDDDGWDDDHDPNTATEMALTWTLGEEEEFERVLGYIIRSDLELFKSQSDTDRDHGYDDVEVVAAYCYDPVARIDDGDWGGTYYSDHVLKLGALLLQYHMPMGWEWEYNDQNYNRSRLTIDYNLGDYLPISPRDLVQNRTLLANWIKSIGKDPQEYLGTWEKIEVDAVEAADSAV